MFFDYGIHDYYKPYLEQKIFGIDFVSPIGLSAGFDKNGELSGSIQKCGFGFAEIGTVTPRPQEGNEKPRLFRVVESEALINSLGFNNVGIDALINNIKNDKWRKIPIGINIGPNKNSIDFKDDYTLLLDNIYKNKKFFDYITINVSSPNTKGLRELQQINALGSLLECITNKIKQLEGDKRLPLMLKLSPDMDDDVMVKDIADLAIDCKIDALIISNTTIEKSILAEKYSDYKGGVSGRPLFYKSNMMLKKFYNNTRQSDVKLIGVGGISSGEDALQKIKFGANLVQLYTSMVYHGPFIANVINRSLIKLLQDGGYRNINECVGSDA